MSEPVQHNEEFDLVVIGSGPGGYVAAIRAAQLGWKVACVEKYPSLGGTCLNVGCIPSKALLESSERYEETIHGLAAHGIRVGEVGFDLELMLKRKADIVKKLTVGIAQLFKKNKVTRFQGMGTIVGANQVAVTQADGVRLELRAKKILITTGSKPIEIPGVKVDKTHIVTSTEALSFSEVPKHLIVIGAGVIGLELGSVWRRLGAKVTVIEATDTILPGMDREIAKLAQKMFVKQGFVFRFQCRVQNAMVVGNEVEVTFADGEETMHTMGADKVLVAVGRRAFTEGLGCEQVGIDKDSKGRIVVNSHYETTVPGIFAVGDVIAGPMLAHKASEEGVACVEQMITGYGHVCNEAIPNIVYTSPEVASVGISEEAAKEQGVPYRVGSFPFIANGRAKALNQTDGLVKFVAHAETDRILGCHIVGARAGDLIAEVALAVEFGGSVEDIARSIHAHPTLAEVVKEAALATDGRALHM